MAKENQEVRELRCSFCGKSQREVQKLIAGPTVYICNGCIQLCNDIIAEEHTGTAGRPPVKPGEPSQEARLTAIARAVHEIADSLRGQWISARPDVTESVLRLADSLDSVSDALQSEAGRAEDLTEPH